MTEITKEYLAKIRFEDMGKCPFKLFEHMNYYVNNGLCLFYNVPVLENVALSFLVGYAEMRQGEYVAVGFKWVNTREELEKYCKLFV